MKPAPRAISIHPSRPTGMNKLELQYADYLETCRRGQLIYDYAFEPERLRIGPDFTTTYCPDFRVVMADGVIEFHEVKGWWREDARVKIKAAAHQHPYIFRAVTRKRGRGHDRLNSGWKWETFTAGATLWLETPA